MSTLTAKPTEQVCAKGVRFTGKVTFSTLRHPKQFNPVSPFSITLYNLIRSICGAIANNNPLLGQNRLGNHRLDRLFNEGFLVPGCGYKDVSEIQCLNSVG